MRFILCIGLISLLVCVNGENWAVSVKDGSNPDDIAEEHGLFNAGEILPNSGIFHFKVKKSSRSKRSVDDVNELHTKLVNHPELSSAELHQDSLVRVKRGPIPQQSQSVRHFVKRQSQGELCFINTIPTRTRESKRCVFPFNYKEKTYLQCTADHSSNGKEWCATEVRPNGDVIEGQWGDCDQESISCFVLNAKGSPRGGSSGNVPSRSFPPPGPSANRPPPPRARPQLQRPPPPQSQRGRPPFIPQPQNNQSPRFPPPGFDPRGRPPPPGFDPRARPPPQGFDPRGRPPPGFDPRGRPPPPGGFPQFPPVPPRRPPSPVVDNEVNVIDVDPKSLRTQNNDDFWPRMWFLNRNKEGLDMNVEDAWEQGYTGKGIKVTILDDGIEHTHDDLKDNYDQNASIDLNDDDDDPFPRYDFMNSNKHGTRCAGTVSATANNSFCAVGIAHNSKIGGVRILDGQITDILEARALSFNRDYVDIYSASWGPDDNGMVVDGPGVLASQALRDGVEEGRNGKGSIFVWASGNGGKSLDNCNCDGYTTSIYTLSVSSASENGLIPWYSESCSSSLATTYSSGSKRFRERKVVTTDLHNKCTDQHTGTSASSPMAAGIVALALEANPNLTWRDVQHLTVRTARPEGNLKATDWSQNGVGLKFSHRFGFGLMDAGQMTRMAKDWKTVPKQEKCTTPTNVLTKPVEIGPDSNVTVRLNPDVCSNIKYIEHLHLHIDLKTLSPRGKLTVILTSPMGTKSVLLGPRPRDQLRQGLERFAKWPMMSVHFWGEPVKPEEDSKWELYVRNGGGQPATLFDFQLSFYGTETDPQPGKPIKLSEQKPIDLKPEEHADDTEVTTFRPKFDASVDLLSFLAQAEEANDEDQDEDEEDLAPRKNTNPSEDNDSQSKSNEQAEEFDPSLFGTPVDFDIPEDIQEIIANESNKPVES